MQDSIAGQRVVTSVVLTFSYMQEYVRMPKMLERGNGGSV